MDILVNAEENTLIISKIALKDSFWVEDILKENRVEYGKMWKSKYNSYVEYDYEPFCSDGFLIELTCTSSEIGRLLFSRQLINKRCESITKLDSLLGV